MSFKLNFKILSVCTYREEREEERERRGQGRETKRDREREKIPKINAVYRQALLLNFYTSKHVNVWPRFYFIFFIFLKLIGGQDFLYATKVFILHTYCLKN